MLQSHPIETFHGEVGLSVRFADVVNRPDVRMIQRRSGSRLAPESFEGRRVIGQFMRKKFQRNIAAEVGVLSFVHHAHVTAAKLFSDAIVGDGLTNQRIGA
jgi:hypothetical protein